MEIKRLEQPTDRETLLLAGYSVLIPGLTRKQTDRQSERERQTDRQRKTQRERQRGRHRERERERERERQRERSVTMLSYLAGWEPLCKERQWDGCRTYHPYRCKRQRGSQCCTGRCFDMDCCSRYSRCVLI